MDDDDDAELFVPSAVTAMADNHCGVISPPRATAKAGVDNPLRDHADWSTSMRGQNLDGIDAYTPLATLDATPPCVYKVGSRAPGVKEDVGRWWTPTVRNQHQSITHASTSGEGPRQP